MNSVFIQIKLINSKRRYDALKEHENMKEIARNSINKMQIN